MLASRFSLSLWSPLVCDESRAALLWLLSLDVMMHARALGRTVERFCACILRAAELINAGATKDAQTHGMPWI